MGLVQHVVFLRINVKLCASTDKTACLASISDMSLVE